MKLTPGGTLPSYIIFFYSYGTDAKGFKQVYTKFRLNWWGRFNFIKFLNASSISQHLKFFFDELSIRQQFYTLFLCTVIF